MNFVKFCEIPPHVTKNKYVPLHDNFKSFTNGINIQIWKIMVVQGEVVLNQWKCQVHLMLIQCLPLPLIRLAELKVVLILLAS